MKQSQPTICITGGTGFLGKHLINLLSEQSHQIKVLTRSTEKAKLPASVNIVAGDLLDLQSLECFIEKDAIVIHLAYLYQASEKENIQAIQNLANCCINAHASRVIHISTAVVVGKSKDNIITPNTPCHPVDTYEKTKYQIEKTLSSLILNRCELAILRPSVIFGEGSKNLIKLIEDIKRSGSLINRLRLSIYRKRKLNLVPVQNVAAAIVFLINSTKKFQNEIYIISDDEFEENNYQDVINVATKTLKLPAISPFFIPLQHQMLKLLLTLKHRSNTNPKRIYDCSKLLKEGFKKTITFKQGLHQFFKNQYQHKINLLCVNMSLDPIAGGGTAERTFQMCRALTKKNINCSVLTLDLGLSDERKQQLLGVKIYALPCLSKRFYLPKLSLRQIKTAVRNADIIHLMNHWTLLNAIVYYYARRYKKPYFFCPAGALRIMGQSKWLKWLYNFLIGKKIVNNAQAVIAVAQSDLQHFKNLGINESKIKIIPNGISPEDYQITTSENLNIPTPFILFLGRLNHIKGPDLLLEAFGKAANTLKKYHLVFAGPDDGMQTTLQAKITSLSLSHRVHFLGYIGGKEKAHLLHRATILAIPSRSEAMSIVVLEAAMTKTPFLASNQCGLNEIAKCGGGIIVEPTVDDINKGLIAILSEKYNLQEMGQKLYEHVDNTYTWDIITESYLKLLKKV